MTLKKRASLKRSLDPCNVLAYACPLPKALVKEQLIILVTGECGAGKDYCADIWVSAFIRAAQRGFKAQVISISDATKREYAAATGANLTRLLQDRTYKEQHWPALTTVFQEQVQQRPRFPEEHFQNVVHSAVNVDVLLITGMRDEAPVAALSHLVPDSRLLEVYVQASEETRSNRRGIHGGGGDDKKESNSRSKMKVFRYCPNFIFQNETTGMEAAERFAKDYLLPFTHQDLKQLANMVRLVPNFPRPGIQFRHVLGISQQGGGLALCTSLLQTHFAGDWTKVDAVVCCEAGGFIYASALASRVDVPLVLIRERGKLPPSTISVIKRPSHISSLASTTSHKSNEMQIEIERDVIPKEASVVMVDDVLATGKTLCAVLELLVKAGINAEEVRVMTVAEFPVHSGRNLLRSRGFGKTYMQSLVVF